MLVRPDALGADFIEGLFGDGNGRVHFGQFGEDAVLWFYLSDKVEGFYVDVGAHHPRRFSNTFLLHRFRSWSGINIDLDHRAIEQFERERPNDVNLCYAVGSPGDDRRVVIFKDGAVNTMSPRLAERWRNRLPVLEDRTLVVRSLASILAEHLPAGRHIDFLNVDAEGVDTEVLRSNDWEAYCPDFVAVEDHGFRLDAPNASEAHRLLTELDYQLLSRLIVTSIYRHRSRG